MTEAKHTPGPWSATSDVDSPWTAALDSDAENPSGVSTSQPIIGANDQAVCVVVGVGWQDDELDANARLIAVAPELLAFVQRIASLDPVFAKGTEKLRIADAVALVAKATR